ncbi:unnamed protein product [Taenia asiatica]|uniref:Ovule protein n=1 Tax=Taenia asiatica TaxID=60517 RepID=A0A0R3VX33_TAEAS|nr:unnamed protein product [Taenia asiatica]
MEAWENVHVGIMRYFNSSRVVQYSPFYLYFVFFFVLARTRAIVMDYHVMDHRPLPNPFHRLYAHKYDSDNTADYSETTVFPYPS